MNTVIILTLVYMLALFTAIVVWLSMCSRAERLKRVKNFKRGKFAFIYLAVIPLFFLAYRYNGQTAEGAFWLAVSECIDVVALGFDYATVAPLMGANLLYRVAVELLFSLVVLNTLMFTASVCAQALANRVSLIISRLRRRVVVVAGTGENTLDILDSVPKKYCAVFLGAMTPQLKEDVRVRRAAYCNLKDPADLGKSIKKLFRDFSKRKVCMILNLEDDEKSLLCAKQLCGFIEREQLTKLPLTESAGLSVYLFAAKSSGAIFAHYVESSNGIIRFINRHKQISMDFIDRYPMTMYMTEREIDYSTATIRDGIDLNVFMVGFGKLNESLFLASVSNNQFFTLKDGKLQPKPVKYHIYDRYYPQGKFTAEAKLHSDNLHHGYLRYEEFLHYYKGKEDEFLAFAPAPAEVENHPIDVTHPDFYTSMRSELANGNTYNYIIISFGTDMENIELAEKLQQKLNEWNIRSFVKIFVKVRDAQVVRKLGDEFGTIEFFGSNRECVYNAEKILNEKIEYMARLRHLLYTAESKVIDEKRSSDSALEEVREKARETWYSFTEYQRESNVYACLSARMKLQLCGFDYAGEGQDASEEFLKLYERGDKRIPSDLEVGGKRIWEHRNDEQFRHSVRWDLAVQEHGRWCANMIANGLVPCSKQEIVTSNKKEMFRKRKHGNLTTMEGLVEFRQIVTKATGRPEEDTDVIRYDYQLMDDIDWLLHKCGYKLIKK